VGVPNFPNSATRFNSFIYDHSVPVTSSIQRWNENRPRTTKDAFLNSPANRA
jgi:hypothetical protein